MVLTLHSKRRTLMFRPCFLRLLRPLLPDMTWEMADRSSAISHLRRRSDSGDYRVDTQNPCRIRRPRHIFLPRQERGAASGPLPGDSGCGHKVGNHSYSHIKGMGNGDPGSTLRCGPCQTSWWSPTSSRPPYGRIRRRQAGGAFGALPSGDGGYRESGLQPFGNASGVSA